METPTFTPSPVPTETLTPTPAAELVYTVVAPGSDTGQTVVFRYEMNAGDVIISTLLFGILLVLILGKLLDLFMKG